MSKTPKTDAFIEGRGMAEDRVIILKYLETISDKFSIEQKPQGKSLAICEFDCGAYKGSQLLRFKISSLNPIDIASSLKNLTSGHRFDFQKAEQALLADMTERVA